MDGERDTLKQSITYEKVRIIVDYPVPIRKGTCEGCGKKAGVEIKNTQKHHTVYKFTVATVRKNPLLALEYTIELGFCCHPIADGFRDFLLANPRGALRKLIHILNVAKLLPEEQQLHLYNFCKLFIKYFEREKK